MSNERINPNMKKLNLSIGVIIIITIISCSNNKLSELSINCACEASEHFITSTNDTNNSTKKYTFTNSQLFNLGVSKNEFANSFAMQIGKQIENNDKFNYIEINIEKEVNGELKVTNSYEYELKKIEKGIPEYFKLESLISEFVVNIYNKNYSGCLELFESDDKEEFKKIIDFIYQDLNKNYISTKIVSYKYESNYYSICGIIKSENDNLDLFTMKLNKTENEFKIISFNF